MQHTKTYVWFGIYGSQLSPDEITARTGVMPSKTWRKGDRGPGPAMVRPRHGWKVESRLTRADTMEDQIKDVLEQIGWDDSKLAGIEDGERVLCCALYMYGGDRPPGRIPERAVRVCAALRAAIDIDLYPMTSSKE